MHLKEYRDTRDSFTKFVHFFLQIQIIACYKYTTSWDNLLISLSSGNIQRGQQSIKRQNGYEEDPEITAQIHLTLANLDANLAGKLLLDELCLLIIL